jgi:hypothetical protein
MPAVPVRRFAFAALCAAAVLVGPAHPEPTAARPNVVVSPLYLIR